MDAALDLEFNEDQQAIAAAVARFCEQNDAERCARSSGQPLPRELWRSLAALGVFAAGAPGHGDAGGVLEICAACEALGEHVFPGPLAATYLAVQALDEETAAGVISGDSLVSLSTNSSTLLPFGTEADLFLVRLDNGGIARAETSGNVEPVETLGGEIWGRGELHAGQPLPKSATAAVVHNICAAAYLAATAQRLIRDTAEHARTRKQFGKSLGEFQAVTHPLADCVIAATAARAQARAAACAGDNHGLSSERATTLAAGAISSAARAGLLTAFTCHQVFGAIGVTLEGPVFHISRRIRQLASEACGVRERELLLAGAGLEHRERARV